MITTPFEWLTPAQQVEAYKASQRALREKKDRHKASGCPCEGRLSYLAMVGNRAEEVMCRHEYPEIAP